MIYPQPDQSRLGGIENDIRYYRHFWSRTTNMFRLKTCTRKLKKLKTCKLEKWSWHPFPCPSMPQASKGKRRDREKYVSATCSVAAERSLSSRPEMVPLFSIAEWKGVLRLNLTQPFEHTHHHPFQNMKLQRW